MSQVTRIYVDGRGWVSSIDQGRVVDPTDLATNEADFGMDGINPIRKPMGWRLTKTVQLDPPYAVDPITGLDITEATEVVPWKYCKVENGDIVELTEQEKVTRDAEIASAAAAEADAEADSAYDQGLLIQAVLVCLKQVNPALNLPTKAAVVAKYKELRQ